MSARSLGWSPLVALLVLLAGLLVLGGAAGPPTEAVPATPPPTTAARGAGRAGLSPTLVGDINNDGIVDIRDYGVWRQQFGATDCGNPADLNGDCIVDIRDYGIWRQNFGQTGPTITPTAAASSTGLPTATPTVTATVTATPALPGRAYITNGNGNSLSVIDTTNNTVVGAPIGVGVRPAGVGVD